jgi:ferredoxin
MGDVSYQVGDLLVLELPCIQQLFDALKKRGYQLVGPTVRDGAIVYAELNSTTDLPVGWTDEQDGGRYRLKRRTDEALFGYNVGPHSWKRFLHPPQLRLWRAQRDGRGFRVLPDDDEVPRFAFVGVRACELHAIAIQDRVFLNGPAVDSTYQARRENVFFVAINCGQAGGTCFCLSMKTGPRATAGFDLALTEVLEDGRHYFVGEVGTERGAEILREVSCQPARQEDKRSVERVVAHAAAQMGRQLDTTGIKQLLYGNYEHPRWDDVAARCLTCANCTMVCPTCFCTTVEDVTDLTGDHAERWRKWDSCFTMDFSYIHGGSVRASHRSRYRQWLTHKLATWIDQFETSGCVGCGRCITWCPVGIDITEEVRAIRASGPGVEGAAATSASHPHSPPVPLPRAGSDHGEP